LYNGISFFKDENSFKKWKYFGIWARWNPDLFLDLIKPKENGITLDFDQRIFLRVLFRFYRDYITFPRGYGKTFIEMLGLILVCIFYPNTNVSMSAQTKEASAKLIKEKWSEISKAFPLIEKCVIKPNFSKDTAEIYFKNGSKLDNLANNQSSKGLRRHRLNMEESALIDDFTFQDALEPIPNIPRRTLGKNPHVNPYELCGQIHFMTTAYFKNTEYDRTIQMIHEMVNLKGSFVLGADWQLACHFGRGETKSQILAKKERLSPMFFATNYESRWIGGTDACVVNIDRLLTLRNIPKAELKGDGKSEYYIGVDVARSNKNSNNQTSIVVAKVKRNKDNKVDKIRIVNLINLPNCLNFENQAIIIKKIKLLYEARVVVVDGNGLGVGLTDELLKCHYDPETGDELIAYDTMNTEDETDEMYCSKCLYVLKSQHINTDIITNFIGLVDSGDLQLLANVDQNEVDLIRNDYNIDEKIPCVQTSFLIEEIANLKLIENKNGSLTVERNTSKYDKDRYSALVYVLYYIMNFENRQVKAQEIDVKKIFKMKKPRIRRK